MNFLDLLWLKARPALGYDSDYAYDCSNRLINKGHYGRRNSDFGWEIGHIKPRCEGGSDSYYNLQPEHWRTNLDKEAARRSAQASPKYTLFYLATGGQKFCGLSTLTSNPVEFPLATDYPSFGQTLDRFGSKRMVVLQT